MPTPETIKKHRRKWYEAMESGEYSRASGVLCRTTKATDTPRGFCCLGLVQDLAKVPYIVTTAGGNNNTYVREYRDPDGRATAFRGNSQGYLTNDGMAWLGVNTPDPRVNFPKGHKQHGETCASLNDAGWSFAQIAAALREFGFHPEQDLLQEGVLA